MKTSRYPIWKSILWSLGILAYFGAAMILVGIVSGTFPRSAPYHAIHKALVYLFVGNVGIQRTGAGESEVQCVAIGLQAGLLALGGWLLLFHRHKTAGWVFGWVLVALTVLAAIYSIWYSLAFAQLY